MPAILPLRSVAIHSDKPAGTPSGVSGLARPAWRACPDLATRHGPHDQVRLCTRGERLGQRVSGGSRDRSCSQAKNRTNARRPPPSWSRMVAAPDVPAIHVTRDRDEALSISTGLTMLTGGQLRQAGPAW